MKKSAILIAVIALVTTLTKAQNQMTTSNLDSIQVLEIVKKKRLLYIDKNLTEEEIRRTPVYQPKISYDAEQSLWNVSSTKYKTTRRGKCRKTNGCTIVTTMQVKVNDKNGRIISKNKDVKKLPSYE